MNTKKCHGCKNEINTSDTGWFYFKPTQKSAYQYWHIDCFKDKKTHQKSRRLSEKDADEFVRLAQEEMERIEQSKPKPVPYSSKSKDELCKYIMTTYNITVLPSSFFVYLDGLFSGKNTKLSRPIPPEDLLDMWTQKISYLERVAADNVKKGKEISGICRVKYDLAILLARYDAYLAYKEKKKVALLEENERQNMAKEHIDYTNINISTKCQTTKVNIASLLDEI